MWRTKGKNIHYSIIDGSKTSNIHRVQLDGAFIANKRILREMKMKKLGVVVIIGGLVGFFIFLIYGMLVATGPRM